LIIRMPSGLGRREGPSAASRLETGLATGPACPIWALMAAPSACTASASLRSPGTASGRIQIW